jgi:Domain of unknown function DUF11/HYR domain
MKMISGTFRQVNVPFRATRERLVPVLLLAALTVVSLQAGGPTTPAPRRPVQGRTAVIRAGSPLFFEENRGQVDPRVKYLSRGSGYTLALTADEALLAVRTGDPTLLRMRLEGANRTPSIAGVEPLPGKIYYAEGTATGPLTPNDMFRRVKYSEAYPGIDLVYYGNDRELEFDFIVAPHADPQQIRLSLGGADTVTLERDGGLSLRARGTVVRLKRPIIYQERNGVRHEVSGGYVLSGKDNRTITFALSRYDRTLPLVIDPTWVFGSTGEDWLVGLEVDTAGQPHVLSTTMDPDGMFFTDEKPGTVGPPNCVLSKLNAATELYTYVVVFKNMQSCDTFTLSPNDVSYFTGWRLQDPRATTVASVNESNGVPAVSYFAVGNYDSSAIGQGITAIAVNSLEHLFLLGPCRIVFPNEPPLELAGYNETPDPAHGTVAEACTPPQPGFTGVRQPILTKVDASGALLYATFLSPGESGGSSALVYDAYGLAADASDQAFIVGAGSPWVTPLPGAFNSTCAGGTCAYLMVLDTTAGGPSSLKYASYLWQMRETEHVFVRLGPTGELYVAGEGQVSADFPNNRPTNPYPWLFPRYPVATEGLQLARFDLDVDGLPSLFNYAFLFNPWSGSGSFRDQLTDLRVLPSGAPVVASLQHERGASVPSVHGTVSVFYRSGEMLSQQSEYLVDLHSGGSNTLLVAPDALGNLYSAFQRVRFGGGPDLDITVDRISGMDPGANTPPAFSASDVTVEAPNANGTFVLFSSFYYDAEDGTTPASGGCDRSSGAFFFVGTTPVTCTFTDTGGLSVTATFQVRVNRPPYTGAPFVGNTATPPDSTENAGVFSYTPVTITAFGSVDPGARAFLTTRLDQNPPIPSYLQAGSPPMYFELSTTGTSGFYGICVDTAGMSFPKPSKIRLYQFDLSIGVSGSWSDITETTPYPNHGDVCGWSETLGTFAILYDPVPATAIETIAGNGIREASIDGPGGNASDDFVAGPAKSTPLPYLYSGAFDASRNLLYVSGGSYIERLNLTTNQIQRIAGNGAILGSIDGPNGNPNDDFVEAGHPINTYVGVPFEMVIDAAGDPVFIDRNTCRIRRLDMGLNQLMSVAGNGTCGYSGDGFNALSASIAAGEMAFDAAGNLFIADPTHAVIRRVDHANNIITTVAGDGTFGIPANGPALSTISLPRGLAFDREGYLLVAGGLHLLRIAPGADGLVDGDADETISVVAGCNTNCVAPFGGDGLPTSDPKVYLAGMGHLTLARDGAVIFPDYHRIRRIAPGADGVVTGAADEFVKTIGGYYDFTSTVDNFNGDTFATQSRLAPFDFTAEDNQGRILIVDTNNYRVRRFGFVPNTGPDTAELEIRTSGPADPIDRGSRLDYSIRVTNHGPADATGVTVSYTLPAGAVFDFAFAPEGSCTTPAAGGTGTVTCTLGTIQSGVYKSAIISVIPTSGGTLSSEFRVTATSPDPDLSNNVSTVTTTVRVPPAVLTILENILVADAPAVRPSVMISINEQIHVLDAPGVLPSAMITVNEAITVTDTATAAAPDTTPPVLTLPGNLTARATGPAGARVFFFVTALDAVSGPVAAACSPDFGATFPIGTTTVVCRAVDAAGNVGLGSFTVTVIVGVPNISMRIYNTGRDPSLGYFVDLEWTNTGTGDSPLVSMPTLTLKTLAGSGTVLYSPGGITPFPIEIPNFTAGGAAFGRLYLQVPATVRRFSITINGTFTNALGATSRFSFGQTVIP